MLISIAYGSLRYEAMLDLRDRVLRRPLGLAIRDEDLSGEVTAHLFGLLSDEMLIACAVISRIAASRVKLSQMAVAPECQGQGYGHLLLKAIEKQLKQMGVTTIELAARVSAQPFYAALGYSAEGKTFQRVNLPHITMTKAL